MIKISVARVAKQVMPGLPIHDCLNRVWMEDLALRRPRRIFRSNMPRIMLPHLPRGAVLSVLGAGLGVGSWLLFAPADLFGRAPAPGGEISAPAGQVAVVDGETLRLQDIVVRLLGVAAPGHGQMCRRNDGTVFDCGAVSAQSLAQIIRGHIISCRLAGQADSGTDLAACTADGRSLNQAQVIGGWARARAELPGLSLAKLGADETEARAQHRGLWAGLFDPSP